MREFRNHHDREVCKSAVAFDQLLWIEISQGIEFHQRQIDVEEDLLILFKAWVNVDENDLVTSPYKRERQLAATLTATRVGEGHPRQHNHHIADTAPLVLDLRALGATGPIPVVPRLWPEGSWRGAVCIFRHNIVVDEGIAIARLAITIRVGVHERLALSLRTWPLPCHARQRADRPAP